MINRIGPPKKNTNTRKTNMQYTNSKKLLEWGRWVEACADGQVKYESMLDGRDVKINAYQYEADYGFLCPATGIPIR